MFSTVRVSSAIWAATAAMSSLAVTGDGFYECVKRIAIHGHLPVSSTLLVMLFATSLAAIVVVVAVTALVVISVLGLFVWGAVQDGREEKAQKASRRRKTPL